MLGDLSPSACLSNGSAVKSLGLFMFALLDLTSGAMYFFPLTQDQSASVGCRRGSLWPLPLTGLLCLLSLY